MNGVDVLDVCTCVCFGLTWVHTISDVFGHFRFSDSDSSDDFQVRFGRSGFGWLPSPVQTVWSFGQDAWVDSGP